MDAESLRRDVIRYGSFTAVAKAYGIPASTVRSRANLWGVTSPHPRADATREAIKLDGDASLPSILPARTDKPLRKVPRATRSTTKPQLIAMVADQHCPHQDKGLESCWLQWVSHNQPNRIVGLGDILNLSKPSRHRANLHDRFEDTPMSNLQAAHDWWRSTLEAAPKATADQLPGNHDLRMQIATRERLPELYDVKRPDEEHPWWDLEYLMGLDKLGVTYHRPMGEYHSVELFITENFGVTHGAKAGPHGGAPKDAAKREHSSATGHAHKASLTVTVRYRDGRAIQHVHVSVPTMAQRDLGYTDLPDTHQGFATLTHHKDGTWNAELAIYDDHRKQLWWRDQTYTAG